MPKDLLDGLLEYQAKHEQALIRGIAKAAARLLDDAINEITAVPLDEGTLRGSGTVHVNGEVREVAPNVGGDPTPMLEDMPEDFKQALADGIIATVGFNTDYAAVMHEGGWRTGPLAGVKIQNYNEPGTGAKFLEKKMSENRDVYLGIVAEELRKIA